MTGSFDPQTFKAHFPLFQQAENQKLVYLDNAATTQRPSSVIQAVSGFYTHYNANTHRSSHRLARAATDMVERTRAAAARFVNAAKVEELIFCRGATEALNLLAHSLGASLKPGDEILLSRAEHHANLVPWQLMAERHKLVLRYLPEGVIPGSGGQPDEERVGEFLTSRTKILSLTAGSNALGFAVDIQKVSRVIKGSACLLVVDGAQLSAHQTIDVQVLGCDFFVCSAHKFYGPTGVGLLYGRKSLLDHMPPWQGGGEMISHVELEKSDWAEVPHRFEAGTAPLGAIAGLEAALQFLSSFDRAAMALHERALCCHLHRGLTSVAGIEVLSKENNNLGIAAFVPKGNVSAADLGHGLDIHDIAVRVGHHCAQPLIDSVGQGATVRASIAAYNTIEDVDRLLVCIRSTLNELDDTGPADELAGQTLTGKSNSVVETESATDNLVSLSLADLLAINDWQGRYRQLLKWGALIQPKPSIRVDENKINGCESDTWLDWECRQGLVFFVVDSDSRVVRGLGALLLVLVNGKSAADIVGLNLDEVFLRLGLQQHLSPSRSNGFYAMVSEVLKVAGSF